MITHLTCTSNSPLHVRRMPCTDTGDLSETLVCLSWKLLGAPSRCNTLEAVTFGDSDGIDHLILLEDCVDSYWLLEETIAEVHLVADAATVDLDLHKVSLLLCERCLGDLCVCKDSDNLAVFLDSLDFS